MRSWGVYVAVALGAVGYNVFTRADRDASGAIVEEGTVSAFQMRVGDCFQDSSSASAAENYEVSEVRGVPCSEPHDNEVFAVFDLDTPSFPEGDAIVDLAMSSCLDRFEGFVGKDYESSSLDITAMYPTQESWNRQNDREVVCAVYDMNLNQLVGSAAGTAL